MKQASQTPREQREALIAQWRERARTSPITSERQALYQCADELEQLL